MDDLTELDAIFEEIGGNEKAEEVASGFTKPADGVYAAEIKKAEYKTSKKGDPMVVISYGLETGETHNDYLMLTGKDREGAKKNVARFVTVMHQLGLSEQSARDYIAKLNTLVGESVTIKIETTTSKAGKEYTNTHILV